MSLLAGVIGATSQRLIVITREALYERVWSEPISKIAASFNLSDRGLAKLCARYDIPTPERGWWAKKQHGHKVKTAALPPSSRTAPITIHKPWEPPTAPTPTDLPPEIAFEHQPENRIVVPERVARLHPFVAKTKAALKAEKPLHYDRPLLFPRDGCLSVNVSRAQVPRALRLMDALVRAFEKRGYSPSIPSKDAGLVVKVLGETFCVSLDEKTQQVKRESSADLKLSSWQRGKPFDLIPSGVLRLRIRDEHYVRGELADTNTHVLEDRLNQFMVKLLENAFQDKRHRDEREKRERAQAEADRLRREDQARAAEEQKKIDQWDQWMTAWKRTQDVRAFAAAIREALAPIDEGSKPAEWLTWAEAYAARIDPLRRDSTTPP